MKTLADRLLWLVAVSALLWGICSRHACGQQISSASFRVDGGVVCSGGPSSSASYGLTCAIGQGVTPGMAVSAGYTMDAGYSIPEEREPVPLRLRLPIGWSMKGSPLTTAATVEEILQDDAGNPIKLGGLQAWDPAAEQYVEIADADALTAGAGFWVFSYWGGTSQELAGAEGSRAALVDQLHSGWNLYSPTRYMSVPDEMALIVFWKLDTDTGQYVRMGVGEVMVPGESYWIYKL